MELQISVIVPVSAGQSTVETALTALRLSDLPRQAWEVIAVTDGPLPEPTVAAMARADLVLRLPGHARGPAYACNRAVEVARAPIVLFLEPWAAVRPQTLRRVVEAFRREPAVAAVVGSFDDAPARTDLVSQYRGLVEHFIHQRSAGEVATFWSTCAAVRRDVFVQAGGFDEWHFSRRQLEDVEFGRRLRALGHRIVIDPEVRVKQLRRWTLGSLVRTDFHDRGVPWGRLLRLHGSGQASEAPRLDARHTVGTALAALATVGALVAPITHRSALLVSIAAVVVGVLVVDRDFIYFLLRRRGPFFTLAAIPFHFLTYLVNGFAIAWGAILRETVGPPHPDAVTQAFAEMGVETWPPVPKRPVITGPTPVVRMPETTTEAASEASTVPPQAPAVSHG